MEKTKNNKKASSPVFSCLFCPEAGWTCTRYSYVLYIKGTCTSSIGLILLGNIVLFIQIHVFDGYSYLVCLSC